jgi:hypothetical protein
MAWIKKLNTFRDFLSLVIVHAPDDFHKEDYLSEDEQLSLESAFAELYGGLRFLPVDRPMAHLRSLLDEALAAYRSGNDVRGAHVLHSFETEALGA